MEDVLYNFIAFGYSFSSYGNILKYYCWDASIVKNSNFVLMLCRSQQPVAIVSCTLHFIQFLLKDDGT